MVYILCQGAELGCVFFLQHLSLGGWHTAGSVVHCLKTLLILYVYKALTKPSALQENLLHSCL